MTQPLMPSHVYDAIVMAACLVSLLALLVGQVVKYWRVRK